MRTSTNRLLIASILIAAGCGSSSHRPSVADGSTSNLDGSTSNLDGSTSNPDLAQVVTTGANVAPMIVDPGPTNDSANVPYVSVTLCIPGTTTCQTIDHVSVDTGSSGLRIVSSVLNSNFTLPQAKASDGTSLVECYQFADGYTWGSVRTADIKIGGEVAHNVPIDLVGDPSFTTVPKDCSSSGPAENSVEDLGGNGLIGVNQFVADCDVYCADPQNIATAAYYGCSGNTCNAVAVAVADQVPNPVAFFTSDNNGLIMQFPSIPAAGAASVNGALIFGIGTQSNNSLGTAKVMTTDDEGNISTVYNNHTFSTSFLDSGTNTYSFNDNSIAQCSQNSAGDGFDCPANTLSLTAVNTGQNGVSTNVSFSVADADSLFSNASYSAFDDLGSSGIDNDSFDWGFPFFFGRSVYVGLNGASTPGGMGPYFAY